MTYIVLLILFICIELLYFKIADKYNIIDKPNHRSSHSNITLRGGGIIFPIAILIAFVLGYTCWLLTLSMVLVAAVSFIDDIKPLHQLPRIGSQMMAFILIAYDLNLFEEVIWLIPIVLILLIGWINAFNFMDGINGITVLYALTAIVSFSILPEHQNSLPLLITMGLSCLVFGFFNVRIKAKTFAGDVGSISLALFLGYFMIKTLLDSGQLGYLLFFSVYGIDAVITIVTRIKKKENIFEAHRSHLYQYLVNEHGYSHVFIAVLYALIQLLLNAVVFYLDYQSLLSIYSSFALLLVVVLIYLLARIKFVGRLNLINK
jgi:UDP-N-acetylmuramyl pentapeptide phosphotransferase/UDP-N-acetylglucosamine-1-phosphate transferase